MANEERPNHSDNKSFPSGHASMAFAVARSIDKEFHRESIWIPIVGYAAATAIGMGSNVAVGSSGNTVEVVWNF